MFEVSISLCNCVPVYPLPCCAGFSPKPFANSGLLELAWSGPDTRWTFLPLESAK